MDERDHIVAANCLLDEAMSFEAKRGYLMSYLRVIGITTESTEAETQGALETLIDSLSTKRERAELAVVIETIIANPYRQ